MNKLEEYLLTGVNIKQTQYALKCFYKYLGKSDTFWTDGWLSVKREDIMILQRKSYALDNGSKRMLKIMRLRILFFYTYKKFLII